MVTTEKHDLVLFTNAYPFGQGESFLENEIPFLSDYFNRLVIVPITSKKIQTRELPNNVTLRKLKPKYSILDKVKLIPHFIKNRKCIMSLIEEERCIIKNKYGYHPTIRIKIKIWHDLLKAFGIKHFFLQKIEPIVKEGAVLYSYWQDNSALALALIKQQEPKYVCICRTHGSDVYFYSQELNYLSFRHYISKTLDQLFFISEDGKEYQRKLLGKNYESFALSRLGTKKFFGHYVKDKNSNKKVIVSCSSITDVKRLDIIIKSLAMIDLVKVDWLHFGNGPKEMEIHQLAEKLLGQKDNISYFFKGYVENKSVHMFYSQNKIDLFINVSSSEGVPVSIMEALSYGIPVIATNVGGTKEIVDHLCGMLIPKDSSPKFIAEAILDVIEQKKNENAYKQWFLKYNAENNFKEFIQYIKNIHEHR